jgi:hypothetical protein
MPGQPGRKEPPLNTEDRFESWAILELMGHRRIAGLVSEQTIGGQAMLRIDIPATTNQEAFTQYYGAGSVYCMTPTTEEIARAVAERCFIRPVEQFELRSLTHEESTEEEPEWTDPFSE